MKPKFLRQTEDDLLAVHSEDGSVAVIQQAPITGGGDDRFIILGREAELGETRCRR